MHQNTSTERVKRYIIGISVCMAVLVLLRTVNFLFCYDPVTGYFEKQVLPILYRVLCGLTLLGIIGTVPAFPRYSFSTKVEIPLGKLSRRIATVCACLCAASSVYFLDAMLYFTPQSKFYQACAILALPTALYFASITMRAASQTVRALSGYLMLIWFGVILAATYLDLYIPMNSPLKTTLHTALIALMLYTLEDIRRRVGRPFRITYLTFTLFALLYCAISSIPVLVAFLTKRISNADYLFYGALMLAFSCYLAARLCDFYRTLSATPPASEAEIAEDQAERGIKKKKKEQEQPAPTEQTKGDHDHVS